MKRIAILTVLVAVTALPAAAQLHDRQADAESANPVGSWILTVTPDPSLGIPPFRELMTFHSDGTLVMVDDNAPAPPFPFTPGHGVWKRSSSGIVFRVVNLLFDPATYASSGQTSIVNRIKVSGDDLTGAGHAKFFDIDGNLMFEADGTLTGQRITVDEP
jgi:hypothetical protein